MNWDWLWEVSTNLGDTKCLLYHTGDLSHSNRARRCGFRYNVNRRDISQWTFFQVSEEEEVPHIVGVEAGVAND